MENFKTLWKGNCISIVSPVNNAYEVVYEPDSIIVLPIIVTEKDYFVGIRMEHCPPYLIKNETNKKLFYTVISGTIETDETPEQAMERELMEEAGVKLIEYKTIREKGPIPLCKVSAARTNFSIVLIDRFEKVEAIGDGTENERLSKTIFVNFKKLRTIIETYENVDFLLYSAYYIMIDLLYPRK